MSLDPFPMFLDPVQMFLGPVVKPRLERFSNRGFTFSTLPVILYAAIQVPDFKFGQFVSVNF